MINFDMITYENRKMHNPRWPEILNHQYRTIINGVLGFEKTNGYLILY